MPGHPTLVWYQPDGTRVVSEGHTLVSRALLCPVSGLRKGGRGQLGEGGPSLEDGGRCYILTNRQVSWAETLAYPANWRSVLCCRRTAATRAECRAMQTPGPPSAPAPGSGTVGRVHKGREMAGHEAWS